MGLWAQESRGNYQGLQLKGLESLGPAWVVAWLGFLVCGSPGLGLYDASGSLYCASAFKV